MGLRAGCTALKVVKSLQVVQVREEPNRVVLRQELPGLVGRPDNLTVDQVIAGDAADGGKGFLYALGVRGSLGSRRDKPAGGRGNRDDQVGAAGRSAIGRLTAKNAAITSRFLVVHRTRAGRPSADLRFRARLGPARGLYGPVGPVGLVTQHGKRCLVDHGRQTIRAGGIPRLGDSLQSLHDGGLPKQHDLHLNGRSARLRHTPPDWGGSPGGAPEHVAEETKDYKQNDDEDDEAEEAAAPPTTAKKQGYEKEVETAPTETTAGATEPAPETTAGAAAAEAAAAEGAATARFGQSAAERHEPYERDNEGGKQPRIARLQVPQGSSPAPEACPKWGGVHRPRIRARGAAGSRLPSSASGRRGYTGLVTEVMDLSNSASPVSGPFRVGLGEDAHQLAAGRELKLAGMRIPDALEGAVAHSDGDAVLHAISDAILGAIGAGDIGELFPDTAPENAGLDSGIILKRVLGRAAQAGWRPAQASVVVTLDQPKLGPIRNELRVRLASLLGLPVVLVGLSFKTSEGLAPQHVQARAIVVLVAADVSRGAGMPAGRE